MEVGYRYRFVNCYVGYGLTSVPITYTPPILPSLQSEYTSSLTEQLDIVEAPVEAQEV